MAIEFEAKLKRWGRSFGIVVPMEKIRDIKMIEDEKFEIVMSKKKNVLKETFGSVKFKRPIKEILDEGDRESWDE